MPEQIEVEYVGKDKLSSVTEKVSRGLKDIDSSGNSLFPGLEKLKGKTEDLFKANTAFLGVMGGVVAGLAAVGKGAMAAFNSFQSYAQSVRDLSQISGTGAEETSKFLQTLDDFQLEAGDVTAATRVMTKNGLVPTVDTLAKLSDQYLAINDPMERNEFIIKNLGKAGMQWVNVLNQGGDALRGAGDEANKFLILTDEQVKKAEEERLAMDALADSWEGTKVAIGSWVGEVILANQKQREMTDAAMEYAKAQGLHIVNDQGRAKAIILYKQHLEELKRIQEEQISVTRQEKDAWWELTEAQKANTMTLDEQAKAAEEASKKNQALLSLTMQLGSENANYTSKMQDLEEELSKLMTEQDKYWEGGRKWREVGGQIDEVKKKITELAEEHEAAGKRILFSLLEQKLAVNGLDDAETDILLGMGVQWGIFDQKTAESAGLMMKNADDMATALDKPGGNLTDIIRKLKWLIEHNGEAFQYYVSIIESGYGDRINETRGTCFVGDTKIILGDGISYKYIQDIQVGDVVLSLDLQTGEQIASNVVVTFKHEPHEGGRLLSINNQIKVTEEHTLWDGKQWKKAGEFRIGDKLLSLEGRWIDVAFIVELPKTEYTYNIHTDHESHNYYANNILVHNAQTKAAGGQLTNDWTLVGEQGYELITPQKYVIPHNVSSMLLASGIVPGARMAQTNDDMGGGGTYIPPAPVGTTTSTKGYKAPPGTSTSGQTQTAPGTLSTNTLNTITNTIVPAIAEQTISTTMSTVEQAVVTAVSAAVSSMQQQASTQAQTNLLEELNDNLLILINRTASADDIGRSVQTAVQTTI